MEDGFGSGFVVGILLVAGIIAATEVSGCGPTDAAYDEGQRDAISGTAIWWETKAYPDGSVEWVKLPKPTTRPAGEVGR